MKVGDMVRPNKDSFFVKDAIGIVLDSKIMASVSRPGLSTDQIKAMGKNVNSHQVYWSLPETKVIWMMERDLEKAV